MSKYKTFNIDKDEKINDCFSRFMTIVNILEYLRKSFSNEDLVRKMLRSLTDSWKSKVTTIYEANDLIAKSGISNWFAYDS